MIAVRHTDGSLSVMSDRAADPIHEARGLVESLKDGSEVVEIVLFDVPPPDCFLEHLQQVPAGWNAKVSDKIDDELSGEVFEEETPAKAVAGAIAALDEARRDRDDDERRAKRELEPGGLLAGPEGGE